MATTIQQIKSAGITSATTVYTAFTAGGATRGQLVSLDICNPNTSDSTVDVWYDVSGAKTYLAKGQTVPALGSVSYRGDVVFATASDLLKVQTTAGSGVDVLGAVLENA